MKPRHQVSRAAIELIKRFEGFREKAARLPDGRWTLGFGHTLTARDGAWVSERDAEALLRYDLMAIVEAVNEHVFTPINQNQFDALCAFAFNIGLPAFKSSAVLMLVNEGQLLQAAYAMELWRKADFEGERIVVDALIRRRAAEKVLFLTPPDGFVPAPTPLIAPHVDADPGFTPTETPAVLRASLEGETAALTRDEAPAAPQVEPAPEAVAAALAQRLARIFPERADELAFPQGAEPTLPEAETLQRAPALAPAAALEPAPERDEVPEPEPEADPDIVQPSAEAETAPDAQGNGNGNGNGFKAFVLSPPAAGEARVEPLPEAEANADAAPPAPQPHKATSAWRGKVVGLAALAALGAVMFGAGVYWIVDGSPAPGGAASTTVIGWVVGSAAVLLMGGAAYVLLDLLGRGDEELEALED